MREVFDRLLKQYEDGKVDRRQLLGALTALAFPTTSGAQPPRYQARSVNHINVVVSDVNQSEAFYRTLLGLPPKRYIPGDAYALDFPDGGFISLCPLEPGNCFTGEATPGRIDHFGIGVDNFDAERVAAELKAAGIDGVETAGPSVFARDPDGVVVQLSSATERFEGGTPTNAC